MKVKLLEDFTKDGFDMKKGSIIYVDSYLYGNSYETDVRFGEYIKTYFIPSNICKVIGY